jgi:hypothetical protein
LQQLICKVSDAAGDVGKIISPDGAVLDTKDLKKLLIVFTKVTGSKLEGLSEERGVGNKGK